MIEARSVVLEIAVTQKLVTKTTLSQVAIQEDDSLARASCLYDSSVSGVSE